MPTFKQEMDRHHLISSLGSIDTELLRGQRNHLLKITDVDIDPCDIDEVLIEGVINLLDAMLDVLDMETGA